MAWLYMLFVVLWVLGGMTAVVFLLWRRGHRDRRWFLLGAILGPLFAPIAAERAWTRSTSIESRRMSAVVSDAQAWSNGLAVLVGVDGSPESDQAVRDAARLVVGSAGRVVLAVVVDADGAERGDEQQWQQARALLDDRAGWLPQDSVMLDTEIAAGEPTRALLDLVEREKIDLLVVGRRGAGLSRRVLGSVAMQVSSQATCCVMLGAPPPDKC
ncbi:MAG: universal stress protein [Actinomycetota bacterium]|nr:universal stress protein [Actinomycetota bacterium]